MTTRRQPGELAQTLAERDSNVQPRQTLVAIGLVLCTYSTYIGTFPTYDLQRFLQVGILAGMGLLVLATPPALPAVPRRARWAAALAMAATGMSVALSPTPLVGLRHVSLGLVLLLAVLAVSAEVRTHGTRATRVGIVGFAILAGLNTLASANLYGSFNGTWANPRFLGQACSWLLPLIVGMVSRSAGRWAWLVLGLGTLWTALLVASASRGAWIAVLIGLTVGAVTAPNRRWWGRNVSLILASGLPLGLLLQHVMGGGRSLENLLGDSGRIDIWERTWEYWLQRPVFGVGPGALSVVGHPPSHPHNAPLQLLTEWGALWMLAVVVVAISLVRHHAHRLLDVRRSAFSAALVSSLTAAVAHSLVSGIIVTPVSQLLGVLVLGVLVADVTTVSARPPGDHRRGGWITRCTAAVAVLGLLGTAWATWPADDITNRRYPRFWLVSPDEFRPLDG